MTSKAQKWTWHDIVKDVIGGLILAAVVYTAHIMSGVNGRLERLESSNSSMAKKIGVLTQQIALVKLKNGLLTEADLKLLISESDERNRFQDKYKLKPVLVPTGERPGSGTQVVYFSSADSLNLLPIDQQMNRQFALLQKEIEAIAQELSAIKQLDDPQP